MYIPPHFQEIAHDEIDAIIEAQPLACIVAQTTEGLIANHIPLLSTADGTLVGHVALANDMHRLIADSQEVLVIFRGENAYISPNFYPSKPEHHRHVPTWNYQVVHVYGTICFQHDTHAKRAVVSLLTRHHERRLNDENAWRMADAPPEYLEQMLGSIVAFRITRSKTLAKSKLSQNREPRDYLGVIAGLRAAGDEAVAERMESRLQRREKTDESTPANGILPAGES